MADPLRRSRSLKTAPPVAELRPFEMLARIGGVLASSLDYETTLAHLAQLMVPDLADWCVVDLLYDGMIRRLAIAHIDPSKVQLGWEMARRYPPDPDEPQGAARVIRTGKPALYEEVGEELLRAGAHDDEHLRLIGELGLRSAMIVPLVARSGVLGAISFIGAEGGRRYCLADLEFAVELGRHAGLAIENAKLFSELQDQLAERVRAEAELRDSEERLRLAQEAANAWTWEIDLVNHTVSRSRDVSDIYGLPPHSLSNRVDDLFLFVHPEDLPRLRDVFQSALSEHRERDFDFRIIRADGGVRWLTLRGRVVADHRGRPASMMGIGMDLTLRREAELASARRRRQLDLLSRVSQQLGSLSDTPAMMRVLLRGATELVGGEAGMWGLVDREQIVPREYLRDGRFEPVDAKLGAGAAETVLLTGEFYISNDPAHDPRVASDFRSRYGIRNLLEIPIVDRHAHVVGCIEIHNKPEPFTPEDAALLGGLSAGAAMAIENAFVDEQRRRSDEALQRSVERLQLASRTTQLGVFEWDLGTGVMYWSEETERIYGLAVGTFPGTYSAWLAAVHPDDAARAEAAGRAALRHGNEIDLEYRIVRPDGQTRWISNRAQVIREASGKPLRIVGFTFDVTERHLAEEAIVKLGAIVESSDDAILSKDLNGIITSWNAGAERLYGYKSEEVIGKPVTILSPPERSDEVPEIMRRLRRGERLDHYETDRIAKDGTRLQVSLTVSPIRTGDGKLIGASAIARDISDRRRTEDALRQTEKLAATGRMAAIIAHEINNPLEAVTNLLYLLQAMQEMPDKAREYVTLAQQELGRVVHITKQTLGFYRDPAAPAPVVLPTLIEELLPLFLRRIMNKHVALSRRVEYDGAVLGMPGELRQVISNLLVNALDAVPDGGRITFHVFPGHEWSTGRTGVRLVFADNGPGIEPKIRRRIFEPFFTTKGEKGTGLGLWVSFGIVQKHGGTLRVRSSTHPGRSGTAFSIFLPAEITDVNGWRRRVRGANDAPKGS